MKVGIMQPYLFPYIGYFQLINAFDIFVFYDDVDYIKGGWINRNTILVNDKPNKFTVSLAGSSSFSKISETKIDLEKYKKNTGKLLKTIEQYYKKAPFFNEVFPVIKKVFTLPDYFYISELAIESICAVSKYLSLDTRFQISSVDHQDSKYINRESRITHIVKKNDANIYINAIGGVELYKKRDFEDRGVRLQFLEPQNIFYKQNTTDFVPCLSIIDVLMFNSVEETCELLNNYELV